MEKRSRSAGLAELAALIIFTTGLVLVLQFLRVYPEASINQIESYPGSDSKIGVTLPYPKPEVDLSTQLSYPSPVETLESIHLPRCQFDKKAAPEVPKISLDASVFSDSKIVHVSSGNIGLVEWLPGNQLVLLTRDNLEKNLQTIELLDPETGESQIYAQRRNVTAPPLWISGLNAVAYSDMEILDATKQPVAFSRQLLISQGDRDKSQLIADNIASFFVTADPETDQIAYITDNRLSFQDSQFNITHTVEFDPNWWKYSSNKPYSEQPLHDIMAWKPGSLQIALYNENRFLLLDTDTGKVCEVDIGGWASVARWSPDGRFLALVRASGSLPVDSSDLAVLDTSTGELYTLQVAPEIGGQQYVTDIAWAPDGRRLIVVGEVTKNSPGEPQKRGLYFVDFVSGQSIHIFPEQSFGGGWWGTNMVWSLDGSKLLVACPTEEEERLCLILVQDKINP